MIFFLSIHRSIVDAGFYAEIRRSALRTCFWYVIRLFFLAIFVIACSRLYYALDKDKGLPAQFAFLLENVTIAKGTLSYNGDLPHLADKYAIGSIIDILSDRGDISIILPDSIMVIDTGNQIPLGRQTRIALRSSYAEMHFFGPVAMRLPYSVLFPDSAAHRFTREGNSDYFHRNAVSLWGSLAATAAFSGIFQLAGTIVFLAAMAFFFGFPRLFQFSQLLKMACFSVTPICIGDALLALTATKMVWPGYLFFCLSVFILLRGMKGAVQSLAKREENGLH